MQMELNENTGKSKCERETQCDIVGVAVNAFPFAYSSHSLLFCLLFIFNLLCQFVFSVVSRVECKLKLIDNSAISNWNRLISSCLILKIQIKYTHCAICCVSIVYCKSQKTHKLEWKIIIQLLIYYGV